MHIIELNLLPPEHQHIKKDIGWIFDRRVVWPVMALFILLCTGAMMWWGLLEKEAELNTEKERIDNEISQQRPLLTQLNTISTNLDEIKKKNLALKSIQVSKQKWISVFETLSAQLPPNTWLLSLSQGDRNPADTNKSTDKSDQIYLTANTHKFEEVAQYMENLVASDEIDSVALKSVQTVSFVGMNVYQMNITAYVNPFIGIDPAERNTKQSDSTKKTDSTQKIKG